MKETTKRNITILAAIALTAGIIGGAKATRERRIKMALSKYGYETRVKRTDYYGDGSEFDIWYLYQWSDGTEFHDYLGTDRDYIVLDDSGPIYVKDL